MSDTRKGIVLAGGTGSRLHPLTLSVSKQLMPVYDKPLIYYPLCTLMQAGMKDILVITTPDQQAAFQDLLGDGSQWGISMSYASQPQPDGIAQALIIAETFSDGAPVALILGDNIFFGEGLPETLQRACHSHEEGDGGAHIFGYEVSDANRYGVAVFDRNGKLSDIVEKPDTAVSDIAVTGLYFYDSHAAEYARTLTPSARGELEITDLNRLYLEQGNLGIDVLGRGIAWLDTGTHESLLDAAEFVRIVERRQGLKISCPEEIAWRMGYIDAAAVRSLAGAYGDNPYGVYLRHIVSNDGEHQ